MVVEVVVLVLEVVVEVVLRQEVLVVEVVGSCIIMHQISGGEVHLVVVFKASV